MRLLKRLYRWLFPMPKVIPNLEWYENRLDFLRTCIIIRCEKIAEARRKKAKRSHLIEANQRDRTEMLRLEKKVKEMVCG